MSSSKVYSILLTDLATWWWKYEGSPVDFPVACDTQGSAGSGDIPALKVDWVGDGDIADELLIQGFSYAKDTLIGSSGAEEVWSYVPTAGYAQIGGDHTVSLPAQEWDVTDGDLADGYSYSGDGVYQDGETVEIVVSGPGRYDLYVNDVLIQGNALAPGYFSFQIHEDSVIGIDDVSVALSLPAQFRIRWDFGEVVTFSDNSEDVKLYSEWGDFAEGSHVAGVKSVREGPTFRAFQVRIEFSGPFQGSIDGINYTPNTGAGAGSVVYHGANPDALVNSLHIGDDKSCSGIDGDGIYWDFQLDTIVNSMPPDRGSGQEGEAIPPSPTSQGPGVAPPKPETVEPGAPPSPEAPPVPPDADTGECPCSPWYKAIADSINSLNSNISAQIESQTYAQIDIGDNLMLELEWLGDLVDLRLGEIDSDLVDIVDHFQRRIGRLPARNELLSIRS